jgi:hypothetical protein
MPDNNQMVTFADLQDLIDNDGFLQNNPFSPTNQLADKLEVIDALLVKTELLDGLADNQMVQLSLIEKEDAPIDNPPTPPTVVTVINESINSLEIQWSGATDDNGIASYIVGGRYVPNANPYWYPDYIPASQDTFVLYGLVGEGTSYNIWVKAVDTIGQESVASVPVQGTTLSSLRSFLKNQFTENDSATSCSLNFGVNLTWWHDGINTLPVVGDRIYETNDLGDPVLPQNVWSMVPSQGGSQKMTIAIDNDGYVEDLIICNPL